MMQELPESFISLCVEFASRICNACCHNINTRMSDQKASRSQKEKATSHIVKVSIDLFVKYSILLAAQSKSRMPLSASSPSSSIIPCVCVRNILRGRGNALTDLRHNCLSVLALDVFERHLNALSGRDLNAWTIDVRNLEEGD